MKTIIWLLILVLSVPLWGAVIPQAHAQAPTCTVSVAAPINQYVLPNVNSGSYGQTPANQLSLTVVGQAENGTWYAIQLPNSNPPTYAWIAAADVASTDGTCGDLLVVNPNDVGASLAQASRDTSPTPASLPECTISATEANIRQSPSTQAPVVGELKPGVARGIGRTADGAWYQVELPNGTGWIAQIVSSQSGDCDLLPVTSSIVGTEAACPNGFVGYTPPRITVGDVGRVLAQSGRVRAEASTTGAIVFQISEGGQFTVIDGPQCNDEIVWWSVEQNGRTGWIAESEASGTYLIEPIAAAGTPEPFICDTTNPNYRPTRLRADDTGVTISTAIPSLIVFTDPDLNAARLGEIPAGAAIDQLNAGPRCNQNAVWWNVTYGETTGWIVESSTNDPNNEYYLLPPERTPTQAAETTPAPAAESRAFPASSGRITRESVSGLAQLGTLTLANAQQMVWGGDGRAIAVIDDGVAGVYRYPSLRPDDTLNDTLNDRLTASVPATAIAFDRNGRYLAVGYQDGTARVIDLEAGVGFDLPPHASPISAVAFSVDNAMLLVASGYFYDQPPTAFDFRAVVYDFLSLNVLDGSMDVMLEQVFGVDEPPLAAGFSIEGEVVVLSYRRVTVIGPDGALLTVRRAETADGALVLPAQSRWFNRLDVVLFGSGPAVAALETATGRVYDRPVVLLNPGVVIAAAQAPPDPDVEPLLAVVVSYPPASGLDDGVRFISPDDNTGVFTTYLPLAAAQDVAFAPDGTVLAVLQPSGIAFYGLP